MRPDIEISAGREGLPACILVHGLGMNKLIWTDPPQTKILGGLFPLGILLGGSSETRTLYHDLKELGYTVITWSQSRPVGPIDEAVRELAGVVEIARGVQCPGIVLIGHSRGGLIARKWLAQNQPSGVKALITISSPHHGTTMARWAVYLSPLASFIEGFVPENSKGTLASAVKKTMGFLQSRGVRELLPGSELLNSLKNQHPRGVYCLSAGGTNPSMLDVKGVFSFPGTLKKLVPGGLPPELTEGEGDGLVSAESSVLPFGDEHLSFHLSHVGILVDHEARKAVLERLERL